MNSDSEPSDFITIIIFLITLGINDPEGFWIIIIYFLALRISRKASHWICGTSWMDFARNW